MNLRNLYFHRYSFPTSSYPCEGIGCGQTLPNFNNPPLIESFPYVIPEEPFIFPEIENGLYPFALDTLDPFILGRYGYNCYK